jgi:hypothetical protein
MRHPLDLRTLAYLVCVPLLIAGLAGLLSTIHVPSATTIDDTTCGSVINRSSNDSQDCADAISARGDWSYPVAILGAVGLIAAIAVRKPQGTEKPRHPEDTGA